MPRRSLRGPASVMRLDPGKKHLGAWASLLVLVSALTVPWHEEPIDASVSRGSIVGVRASDHNTYGVNNDLGMINWSIEYVRPSSVGNGQLAHQRVREAGIGWVRYWLSWETTEPQNSSFNWLQADHDINAAIDQGLTVYITIMGAPAWPHGGKQTYHWGQCDGPIPGADFDSSKPDCGAAGTANAYAPFDPGLGMGQSYHWRRFVDAAVTRYGDRVKYWGFWNESGNQWFWPEWPEAPYHSRGKQLVDKVIKPGREAALAANPSVVIVGPEENDPNSLEFYLQLEQLGMPAVGVPPYGRLFDVFSVHAYNTSPGGLTGVLNTFRTKIAQFYPREVWITETNGDSATVVAALEQLTWRGWISKVFFFRMRGEPPSSGVGCGFELLDVDKNPCPNYPLVSSYIQAHPPSVHFAGATATSGHNDFVLLQNPHFVAAGVTLGTVNK